MEKTTRKKRTNKNLTSRRSLVHWCPKKNKKFRTKKIMTRKAKKTKKRRKKRCWRRRSQKKDKNKHDRSVETKTTTLISFEGIFMTIEVRDKFEQTFCSMPPVKMFGFGFFTVLNVAKIFIDSLKILAN
jgi:hypothetical protein